jgi:two-component system, OmpR family, sensor histidine kinase BaeS
MLNTLYRRLIVSHVLPLLLSIPLMGIAFVYVLETQVLLPNMGYQATGQAVLVAEIAADRPQVWVDTAQAQALVDRVAPSLTAQVMLLDRRGRLLASSDAADAARVGQRLDLPDLSAALAGVITVHTDYPSQTQSEAADAMVPLVGSDGSVAGVVRVVYRQAGVYDQFQRVRYLILGVLAVGLLLGAAVGWLLALNLARPLRQVTSAVYRLASGDRLEPLPERGPREMQQLSRSVNSLVEHQRSLEEARRQLLANLVHELGRPLGALGSAVQALLGGACEDASLRNELLVGIQGELRRLKRLLDDLAGLHDQVLGNMELGRVATPLSQWLPPVLASWQAAATAKGLSWQASIPADLPTLNVDPDRLAQAMGNLLSNAVKYTPPGGAISIDAGAQGEAVRISVRDTGAGILPEDQAHVFDPFYRGRQSSRFRQGLGLGLTIADDLVKAHGGRLEMESTPGEGSRFTIVLPCP